MQTWYALCEYKKKKPHQIQASQHIDKLQDKLERLQEQYPNKRYAIKTTLEFDKERKK